MHLEPRLIDVHTPEDPAGVVLVLHGGGARRDTMMVSPTQLSVLRMIPIARRIARSGQGRLAVFRLLNSRRGWDATHTPVRDANWALDVIAERYDGVRPSCLVGHSLGGRAALLAGGRDEVVGVAALAPWVYPTDVAAGLRDTKILIVHGTRDRIADPDRSAALARRLGQLADVSYVTVPGGTHSMLRHRGQFDGRAARFAVETLVSPRAMLTT